MTDRAIELKQELERLEAEAKRLLLESSRLDNEYADEYNERLSAAKVQIQSELAGMAQKARIEARAKELLEGWMFQEDPDPQGYIPAGAIFRQNPMTEVIAHVNTNIPGWQQSGRIMVDTLNNHNDLKNKILAIINGNRPTDKTAPCYEGEMSTCDLIEAEVRLLLDDSTSLDM